jgi:membrane protease YdiL (CAAX protease family)
VTPPSGLHLRPAEPAREDPRRSDAARANRSITQYVLLVFALSTPFWLLGAATDLQVMPGLSVSALMALCPMAAALFLVHRESGSQGVIELLRRSFDFRRIEAKRWLVPVLLLMPGVSVMVYGLMRWADLPLPDMQITALSALLMFLAFFVGALGEELGWSGYVLDPMQNRWGALGAGCVLGVVTAAWHLPALFLSHRSPSWIAWWCLYGVAARILIVWLYNNTGRSVFAVTVFHATLNLSYMLFPVYGSHFDMRLGGLVTAGVAAMVAVVWRPRTPARQDVAWSRDA